jgi:hypothetical protein
VVGALDGCQALFLTFFSCLDEKMPQELHAGSELVGSDLIPEGSTEFRRELRRTMGDQWLEAQNVWLDGQRPVEIIGTSEEYKVRDIYRSILTCGLS